MKNLNKVLAMLVVFMMVVSTVAFASFTDVAEDSTYNVAIKVGTDLGLFTGYEDGSFKPEGEITRAEFAAIVVRMKGQEAQADGAKSATMFADVPADHWAAGYINIAVRLGIINGYGDGNFGPSDLVQYQDAITMMVRALGYDPAIGAAGYPTGYLTKAGDLGLTANVNGVNGIAINRGKVAQVVFNALDVPLMTQSGYGTFTQYVVNDGYSATTGDTNVKKTLLSENHNIIKVMGNVKSSTNSTAATETGAEKVNFEVTNTLLNKYSTTHLMQTDYNMEVAESGASAFVGKKVIAFVHVNEFTGAKTIISLYDAPVADELVVALQDLDDMPEDDITTAAPEPAFGAESYTYTPAGGGADVTANFRDFSYTYYNENGRTATITAAKRITPAAPATAYNDTPDVYVNGVNWNEINNKNIYDSVADLNNLSGTITFALLDTTNTTADYDTIYIDAAMPFVVNEVKTGNSTVKGKAIGTINRISFLEEDGVNEATLYGTDGAEMDWADLEENDVLMVKYIATNSGKHLYEATLVDNVIEGKVDGTAGTRGTPTREIVIGGVAYKVAGQCEFPVAIAANDEGKFFLDANDNIVYFDKTASISKNYGYVVNVSIPKSGDFLAGYQVQILTKDNTVVVYDLYKRIRLGATSGLEVIGELDATGAIVNDTPATGANQISCAFLNGIVGDVITYNVNSANEITAIFTEVAKSSIGDDEDLPNHFTYDDTFAAGTNNLTGFDPDDMSFTEGYTVDENTVIFWVKDNGAAGIDSADRKKGEVVALPVLEENDTFVNAKLYNVDADDYISCILIEGNGSRIGTQSENATFVLKVSETTDDDGNTVYTVTGYKDCEVVTYTVDNTTLNLGTWYDFDGTTTKDDNGDTVADNATIYDMIGRLVVPEFAVNGDVENFKWANGNVTSDGKKNIAIHQLGAFDKIDGYKLMTGTWTDANSDTVAQESEVTYSLLDKFKSDANVYVYDSRKAGQGRGHYQIDADGYLDWDFADGIYYGTNLGEKNLTVTAIIFNVDTDKGVDVLFYIH